MSHQPVRWLLEELPALVRQGVLDEAAAARLRRHYAAHRDARPGARRPVALFGALGGLLIGSGVVLLVAHNWASLGRPARAAIAFGLLLTAQAVAGFAAVARRHSTAWTEGAGLSLTLAVTAAIALVAQTYQIGGDAATVLLQATVLSIPAVYLLVSRGAAALVCVGATAWLFADGSWPDLTPGRLIVLVALTAAMAPFLVRLDRDHRFDPRTALLGWVAGGALILAGVRVATAAGNGLWLPLVTGLLGTMYATSVTRAGADVSEVAGWRRPFHALGALGSGVLLLVLSFRELWRELTPPWESWQETAAVAVLTAGIAIALVAIASVQALRLLRRRRWHRAMLCAVPLLSSLCWLVGSAAPLTTAVAVNLFAFGTGLTVCLRAMRDERLGDANAGLLLMIGILAMRFLDADLSFVARGVAFILIGAGFLAVNLLLFRRRAEVRP